MTTHWGLGLWRVCGGRLQTGVGGYRSGCLWIGVGGYWAGFVVSELRSAIR
jgi:hypothetical protein